MTGFARFIPLLVIVVLVTLFALMLGGDRNPKEIKSVLIGKPVPEFSLPALNGGALITQQSLKTGKPLMVNFFASWC
ncbi:MAG: DsbE family thiol:disulfide interchange protein, partial [Kordiimonadaceae bacterium]|nr:DsbE family thiol:disulfide interchange protein [Kordiimonadaceae bacterium]